MKAPQIKIQLIILFLTLGAPSFGQALLPPQNDVSSQPTIPLEAAPQPEEVLAAELLDGQETQDGLELLTRGPLHEAFAVSPAQEPRPGVIVRKAPPQDISEVPPAYEAAEEAGESIWIPGYWAWDEDRNDYIWVSGAWRVSPPDRNWIPGYWHETENGHQWVSGFWAAAEAEHLSYVEPPPPSIENGPSIPAPDQEHFWIPGNWVYQDDYQWQPGRWCAHQDSRVWIPAHYVWTPSGCLFVNGYWDYQLPERGQLYAPVHFSAPVVAYRPSCELQVNNLLMHLFVSRNHRHYLFGDYYGNQYRDRGCFPLHQYAYTARRYDPLYSYYNSYFARRGIDCHARLRGWHSYYTNHVHHRPPRTWSAHASFALNISSHPHLSRTVLARSPRVSLSIHSNRRSGHHNRAHQIRHQQLRDLARERQRTEARIADRLARSNTARSNGADRHRDHGNRRRGTLAVPQDLRRNMPRNSFKGQVADTGRRRPPEHSTARPHRDDYIADKARHSDRSRTSPREYSANKDKRAQLSREAIAIDRYRQLSKNGSPARTNKTRPNDVAGRINGESHSRRPQSPGQRPSRTNRPSEEIVRGNNHDEKLNWKNEALSRIRRENAPPARTTKAKARPPKADSTRTRLTESRPTPKPTTPSRNASERLRTTSPARTPKAASPPSAPSRVVKKPATTPPVTRGWSDGTSSRTRSQRYVTDRTPRVSPTPTKPRKAIPTTVTPKAAPSRSVASPRSVVARPKSSATRTPRPSQSTISRSTRIAPTRTTPAPKPNRSARPTSPSRNLTSPRSATTRPKPKSTPSFIRSAPTTPRRPPTQPSRSVSTSRSSTSRPSPRVSPPPRPTPRPAPQTRSRTPRSAPATRSRPTPAPKAAPRPTPKARSAPKARPAPKSGWGGGASKSRSRRGR